MLQIGASAVKNWGSYYKLGQPLLQNRAGITNWGKIYYKLGQVLQIKSIIIKWDITLSIGVLIKWCSENMQQIHRRTPMSKCDHTSAWAFSYKFAAYF